MGIGHHMNEFSGFESCGLSDHHKKKCILADVPVIGGEHNSYNYESNPSGITRNPLKEEKRLKDSLIMSKMIMDFAKAHKFNLQEMEASSAFCLRNFVNAKNLLQDDFYKEISDVLGDSKLLRKLRRKAIFKSIRRKIVKIIKSIVTVKLEN